MKWIWLKRVLLVGFPPFFLIAAVQLVAQESNNGNLEIYSSGYLQLGLKITNGNPKVSVINANGQIEQLPAFVAEKMIEALNNGRSSNFPLCLSGDGEVVTVAVGSGDKVFETVDGSQVPFEIFLASSLGESSDALGQNRGQKAQYQPRQEGLCDEESALQVEIVLEDAYQPNSSDRLKGKFTLIVSAE
jgi:hypothetical protein